MSEVVELSVDPLALGELLAIADGARVELDAEVLELIRRSRAVVDRAVERGDAIYGVTTGVGHLRNERLPVDELQDIQPVLVAMHLGGMGANMSTRRVRAAMAARLNGIARGGAGVSVAVAEMLVALLNERIHPLIPESGSVGAADLGQLASVAQVVIGHGQVEKGDRLMSALDALRSVGLEPVALQPKDALGLISSNAVAIGRGSLIEARVRDLVDTADLVAAVSMEAIRANPSIIDPSVASARASAGQIETSRRLRDVLAGSARVDAGSAHSVQDPLSFRVVPQVHGACRDFIGSFATALEAELNAPSDNPLVDVATERILSNGNFHAMNVAISSEALRVALGHVGLLSERRSGQLFDAYVGTVAAGIGSAGYPTVGAPPFLAGVQLRYPAAARYTRLRRLAEPVTLDIPALDRGVEDHATNAPEALELVDEIATVVGEILAVELLLAIALLGDPLPVDELGEDTARLVSSVATILADLPIDTSPGETHSTIATHLGLLPT